MRYVFNVEGRYYYVDVGIKKYNFWVKRKAMVNFKLVRNRFVDVLVKAAGDIRPTLTVRFIYADRVPQTCFMVNAAETDFNRPDIYVPDSTRFKVHVYHDKRTAKVNLHSIYATPLAMQLVPLPATTSLPYPRELTSLLKKSAQKRYSRKKTPTFDFDSLDFFNGPHQTIKPEPSVPGYADNRYVGNGVDLDISGLPLPYPMCRSILCFIYHSHGIC